MIIKNIGLRKFTISVEQGDKHLAPLEEIEVGNEYGNILVSSFSKEIIEIVKEEVKEEVVEEEIEIKKRGRPFKK